MDALLDCTADVSPALRETVRRLIDERVIASARYKHRTASTNSDASEELQTGRLDGTSHLPRLYLTDLQTAGRGRQGNTWISDEDALTFSLAVPVDLLHPSTSLLSPAVGVAVAKAIEFSYAPCRIGLKWPNDLCVFSADSPDGHQQLRKLGGVLIESVASVSRRCIIGIGLNLNRAPKLSHPSAAPPTSLSEVCSRRIRREDLLPTILESLNESLDQVRSDPGEILSQYRSRCSLTGKDLSLYHGGEDYSGFCTGITDEGALELVIHGGRRVFRSGEVQRVRPL